MKPRHAVTLALVGFSTVIAIAGCGIEYSPKPDPSMAGWKCPDPDKMPSIVTYSTPPCIWILGALFASKSCQDQLKVKRETALGCVAEQSPTPTAIPLHSVNSDAQLRIEKAPDKLYKVKE
jgi:hypothetical protein